MIKFNSSFQNFKQWLQEFIPKQPRLSPQDEDRCRAHFIRVDATQTSLGMLLFLMLVVPSFANDYQFFGQSTAFYMLTGLRIVIILSSVIFIIFIRKVKSPDLYDRIVALWQLISIIVVLAVNLSRPADYYMFAAIDISIISTMYIVFRSRFAIQATLASAFTIADLSIILLTKDLTDPALRAIVAGYILANGLGMTALWMLNISRHSEFLSHEQETAALKEKQRLEAEKYRQSRLESIGSLAGGIAHDFNNILTGIIGNIDMANEALDAHNNDEVKLRLKDAMHASEQGKNLSSQILNFARGNTPDMKTIALQELIREATGFSLHGSNVKSQISLDEALWPVEADKDQISQVISNLVINARQSMPGGGIVKISARNITRGSTGENREVRFVMLEIEDNGPGIPPDKLNRIFDPFFTTREGGYGMGLPVAYSIIKKHGGFIEAQSIMGAGSLFYVYLPASDKRPQIEKQDADGSLKAGSGRILLMDDEESIRELLLRGLERAGYTAEAASNGAEALAMYHKTIDSGKPYDAVVLDLTIPGGMGGLETIKELQKLNPHVIAIASSGYSDDPIMASYKQYGFSGILVKPYTISVLLSTLGKALHEDKN
jgi:signal transduction histidine kinase/ActR/RegA family two-component response regulator